MSPRRHCGVTAASPSKYLPSRWLQGSTSTGNCAPRRLGVGRPAGVRSGPSPVGSRRPGSPRRAPPSSWPGVRLIRRPRATARDWAAYARPRLAHPQVGTGFISEVLIIPRSWVRPPPAPPPRAQVIAVITGRRGRRGRRSRPAPTRGNLIPPYVEVALRTRLRPAWWWTGSRCGLTDDSSAPCRSVCPIPTHEGLTPCDD